MKKTIKTLIVLVAIILMSSFTDKNANNFIGTYGVSASDPAQIKLIINPDHSFYYQDFSIPDKKIVISGNWALKGKKVILENNLTEKKFHNIWSFAENGQIAKSRKGFTFYRLGKIVG